MGVALNPNAHYTHVVGTDLVLPVTICGWLRLDADRNDFTTVAVLCKEDDLGADVLLFALNSDGVTPVIYDESFAGDINGTAMTLGTWYFVAVTAAAGAGNYRFYQVAEGGILALTDSSTFAGGVLDGELLGVGGGRPDGEDVALNLDGSLAYWRLWSAALTLTELQAEMASATPARTTNLFASYRFENTSNATTDGSGNGNHLTAETGTGSFANTGDPDLGGTDVTGTAVLAGGGTLAASGQRGIAGIASLTGGGTLAAAGARGTTGQGALAGGGALAGSGVRGVLGSATLTGAGSLTASGVRGVTGAGSLAGGGSLSATGVRSTAGSAQLAGGGSLVAAGLREVVGTASLAGGGTLAASGTIEGVVTGSGALIGGGLLTSTGTRGAAGVAVLAGGGTLAATGVREVVGVGTLTGGGSLTAVSADLLDPNPSTYRVRDAGPGTLTDPPIARLRERR